LDDYKSIKFSKSKKDSANPHQLVYNYLTTKMDCQLIKAAVMSLIYAKSAYSFAEDLKRFFEKHCEYPSKSTLLTLANFIISKLKNHRSFIK